MLLFVVLSDILLTSGLKINSLMIIFILSSLDSVLPKLLVILKVECLISTGICINEDNFSGVTDVAVNQSA